MNTELHQLAQTLTDWRGTAAELADKANSLLSTLPALTSDTGSANERLVRHYVQMGAVTAPEREGREARFGPRQVLEFLATRYLLKDGWPLAKAAELVRGTDMDGLAGLIPSERTPTKAQEVAERYRPRPAFDSMDSMVTSVRPTIARAGDISRRRVSLEEHLKVLGNARGRPDRRRVVRIELTPWCHVDVQARELAEMTEDTPATLGAALTQALQEERLGKGKQP